MSSHSFSYSLCNVTLATSLMLQLELGLDLGSRVGVRARIAIVLFLCTGANVTATST